MFSISLKLEYSSNLVHSIFLLSRQMYSYFQLACDSSQAFIIFCTTLMLRTPLHCLTQCSRCGMDIVYSRSNPLPTMLVFLLPNSRYLQIRSRSYSIQADTCFFESTCSMMFVLFPSSCAKHLGLARLRIKEILLSWQMLESATAPATLY